MLAGDFHPSAETAAIPPAKVHMMRCMLVSNLDIPMRFVNGTQGRLLHWHPEKVSANKCVSAGHPEMLLVVREHVQDVF